MPQSQGVTTRPDADPAVDVVIVNWNSGAQLRECIASLAGAIAAGAPVASVTVVDNASADGSASALPDPGRPLAVVANGRNRGFGAACNQGAASGWARYLLFLNPDTRVTASSIAMPAAHLDAEATRGAVAAGVRLVDAAGRTWRSCARRPRFRDWLVTIVGLDRLWPARFPGFVMHDWPHDTTRDVDHVIGAFLVVRRDAFERAGGFDERYFVYLEDLDLSLRLRDGGGRLTFLADASAFHRGGGTSDRIPVLRVVYSVRSRIVFLFTHHSRAAAVVLTLLTVVVEPLTRTVYAVVRARFADVPRAISAGVRVFAGLPSTLATALRRPGATPSGR